ncbi:putative viral structural protein [Sulfolobus polyhedral virus 2]|uniref:Putative viral structural protein n=1 Tax=Sulfolobus polyhedral virus 2 TaxID=2493125 RepID=A0A3Q8Q7H2_9VIRU|nr:putative viral structural protein [Sulfolobus polyhedral virus 2]AZI76038.1 putative viral structural protein [Sulfolobus polyhedral virus 2]
MASVNIDASFLSAGSYSYSILFSGYVFTVYPKDNSTLCYSGVAFIRNNFTKCFSISYSQRYSYQVTQVTNTSASGYTFNISIMPNNYLAIFWVDSNGNVYLLYDAYITNNTSVKLDPASAIELYHASEYEFPNNYPSNAYMDIPPSSIIGYDPGLVINNQWVLLGYDIIQQYQCYGQCPYKLFNTTNTNGGDVILAETFYIASFPILNSLNNAFTNLTGYSLPLILPDIYYSFPTINLTMNESITADIVNNAENTPWTYTQLQNYLTEAFNMATSGGGGQSGSTSSTTSSTTTTSTTTTSSTTTTTTPSVNALLALLGMGAVIYLGYKSKKKY